MLTKDGTCRRTPGGIFFQLVQQQATRHERRSLFPYPAPQRGPRQPQKQFTTLTWNIMVAIRQWNSSHKA
jgi:hypothetical protein